MTTTTASVPDLAAAQAKRDELIRRHTSLGRRPDYTDLVFHPALEAWAFHIEHAHGTWDQVLIPQERAPLYVGPDDRVTCRRHDRHLSASVVANPTADRHDTPFGGFTRLDADAVTDRREATGRPVRCETCGTAPLFRRPTNREGVTR